MNDLIFMYDLHSSQYLVEDIEGFVQREYFGWKFALNIVKIAHIAILHDEEVPVSF